MGCRPKLPSSVWYIIFALSSSAFSLAFFLSYLLRCNCVKMLISPYVISVISKRQAARQQTVDLGKRGRGRVGSGAAGQLEQLRQQLGHSSRLASSSSSRGLHTMACAWEKSERIPRLLQSWSSLPARLVDCKCIHTHTHTYPWC